MTRSRERLSPERIVDGALELVEAEGAGALTYRRLGTALGVDPAALYRHFAGKDELLLGVADRLLGEALDGFVPAAAWRPTVEDLCGRLYRALVAHPEVARIAAARTTRRPNEFVIVEHALAAFTGAGLPDADAAAAYRAVIDTTLAFAALDATFWLLDPDAQEGDRTAWSREYAALPPDGFPNAARLAAPLARLGQGSLFPVALRLILDGVEHHGSTALTTPLTRG